MLRIYTADPLHAQRQSQIRDICNTSRDAGNHVTNCPPEAALATAEALLPNAKDPQLTSAVRLLKGQALRGQAKLDAAAVEMRAAADSNPLVAPAIRLELAEMWLDSGKPDQAAEDARKGLDNAEARLLRIELAESLGRAEAQRKNAEAAMDAYRQLLTAAGTAGYLGEQL